jgi:adenine-specific DNA-methyltransferase
MATPAELGQYFTPAWACELIVRNYYPNLNKFDVVRDPACGDGRFLAAIPAHVPAFGIEIDPVMAQLARQVSGRDVICADFATYGMATMPEQTTLFIGNPPFKYRTIMIFLDVCWRLLQEGGRVGFILPSSFFQTSTTLPKLAHWSLAQDMLPRDLFDGLRLPLNFVQFTKSQHPVIAGFFLYTERAMLNSLRKYFREMFTGNKSRPNVWKEAVYAALKVRGGRATLAQLYETIEESPPTDGNQWIREKVRQVAGQHFTRVAPGVFEIPEKFQTGMYA